MEQFRSLSLILMSLLLCVCFTDGAINSWQLNSETAIAAENTPIAVAVAETSDVTTVLFTLTATVDTGALVSYVITNQPNAGQFKIGDFNTADAGKVQLESNKCIDYEGGSTTIEIEVTATDDTAVTALTGVATVTITITDVTTYTPVFTTPSTFITCVEIPDQAAVNDAVYTVVAADAVTNTITYSIVSGGNTDTDFAIDGTSGAITVANALDKARTALYGLVVYGTGTTTPTCIETRSVLVVVSVGMPCPCPVDWCDGDADNGAGTAAVSVITLMTGIVLFELM